MFKLDIHNTYDRDLLQFSEDLLELIPRNELREYHNWIKIVDALKTIHDSLGLDSYQRIYELTTKLLSDNTEVEHNIKDYMGDINDELFEARLHMVHTNCTGINDVRTIGCYAELYNPTGYKEYHNKWCQFRFEEVITSPIKIPIIELASLFYALYWLRLSYDASSKKGCWWEHNGTLWNKCVMNGPPSELINNKFMNYLHDQCNNYSGFHHVNGIIIDPSRYQVIRSMSYANYKTIARDSRIKFADQELNNRMDKTVDIHPLRNMIVEVVVYYNCDNKRSGYHIIRPGIYCDYRSHGSGVDYYYYGPLQQQSIRMAQQFMEKICPDPDVREYVYKLLSTPYIDDRDRKIHVFIGASNLRPILERVIDEIYGTIKIGGSRTVYGSNEAVRLPTTMLSNKNIPTREWSRYLRANVVTVPDLPLNTIITEDIIKKFSDTPMYYQPISNDTMDESHAKLFMFAGILPSCSNTINNIFMDRIVIIPHDNVWCNDAPNDVEEQLRRGIFPASRSIYHNTHIIAEGLNMIIIDNYID